MSDDAIRIAAFRPPTRSTKPSIELATKSAFQNEIVAEARKRGPNLRAIARRHVATFPANFVTEWIDDAAGLDQVLSSAIAKGIAGPGFAEFVRTNHQNQFPLFVETARRLALSQRLFDSTVAAYVLLGEFPLRLEQLVAAVRSLRMIGQVADAPQTITLSDMQNGAEAPVALPLQFGGAQPEIPTMGVMDLFLLRHHVVEYVRREIGTVENVMAGESRTLTQRETVTTERETTDTTDTERETSEETTVAERFAFKHEAENTTKEDLQVKAGLRDARVHVVELDGTGHPSTA
jgi:hypothetical protein